MERSAVVLAAHPRNAGMFSVDQSAMAFFKGQPVRYFCSNLYGSKIRHLVNHRRNTRVYRSVKDLEPFDKIVFWGDFLNNPLYAEGFARSEIQRKLSPTLQDARLKWEELMMLSGLDCTGKKIVSVGNNFMSIRDGFFEGFQEEEYRRSLRNFDYIFPRDPLSTKEIMDFVPRTESVTTGFDCAHLQPTSDIKPIKENHYFVYFFGRSDLTKTKEMVRRIEAMTGLRGVDFSDWFNLSGGSIIHPLRLKWLHFHKMRRQIAFANFILTDVYHLSVNAINLRKLVFLVGRAGMQSTPISDLKKKVLFDHLGLSEFYIQAPSEDVMDMIDSIAEKMRAITEYEWLLDSRLRVLDSRLVAYEMVLRQSI